jgi:hypothetical protein
MNRFNWNQKSFNLEECSGSIINNQAGDILITGSVVSSTPNPTIYFWAASPPNYGTSFSGSGQPYPNPEVAYSRTANAGSVVAENKQFSFKIKYPNAYYVGLGTLYVPPHVNIKVVEPGMSDKFLTLQLDDGIPFRTLTYPAPPSKNPRISPMFYYAPPREIRTQEQILRDSGYPIFNKMPDNFWGDKPPR